MSAPQNPSAFPVACDGDVQEGMTLRDWFAGQALTGYIACPDYGEMTAERVAAHSYAQADAMLAARGEARRYPIEHTATGTRYGPWTIYFDPPPIPTRGCDWHFVHRDFDGAPDANDSRFGSTASFADALNACDAMEDGE